MADQPAARAAGRAPRLPIPLATSWRRRTLQARLAAIVRSGVAAGQLREVSARLAAITIISNDEAVQNWYRHRHPPDAIDGL